MVQGFVFNDYGFTLRLDNEVPINAVGWTETSANTDQGLLSFAYNGTNSIVFWIHNETATSEGMLADIYQTLRAVDPDKTFVPISEGDITVSGVNGTFGGFALTDSAGSSESGGLIGAWVCQQSNTAMGLTVISAEATTLQVRFNRLLQGLEC